VNSVSRAFRPGALVIVAVGILPGCATITRGSTEVLVIETQPPGADVELSPAGLRCKTPCSLELKRKKDVMVKINKPGYEPVETSVLSEVAGAGAAGMAGNVILGGIIGAGVDVATGSTKKLTPNPLKVMLVPIAPVTVPPTPAPILAPAAAASVVADPVVSPALTEALVPTPAPAAAAAEAPADSPEHAPPS
jgi:hypothetical protein